MMSTKERLVFKMLQDACSDFCARYDEGKPKYKQSYLQMAMALEAAGIGTRETVLNQAASVVTNTPTTTEQKQGETKHDTNAATADA